MGKTQQAAGVFDFKFKLTAFLLVLGIGLCMSAAPALAQTAPVESVGDDPTMAWETTQQSIDVSVNGQKIDKITVNFGDPVHISWTSLNARYCSVSDNSGTGSAVDYPLNHSLTYRVSSNYILQHPTGYVVDKHFHYLPVVKVAVTCLGYGQMTTKEITIETLPPTAAYLGTFIEKSIAGDFIGPEINTEKYGHSELRSLVESAAAGERLYLNGNYPASIQKLEGTLDQWWRIVWPHATMPTEAKDKYGYVHQKSSGSLYWIIQHMIEHVEYKRVAGN